MSLFCACAYGVALYRGRLALSKARLCARLRRRLCARLRWWPS